MTSNNLIISVLFTDKATELSTEFGGGFKESYPFDKKEDMFVGRVSVITQFLSSITDRPKGVGLTFKCLDDFTVKEMGKIFNKLFKKG